jgi:hypothetical protein
MSSAILFAVSPIAGFVLGRFSWHAIVISSAALAVLAAAVLQQHGFAILPGIAIIVACLVIHQVPYLARVWFIDHSRGAPVQNHARHHPGQSPSKDDAGKVQEHQKPHLRR